MSHPLSLTEIGLLIAERRKERGLRQRALADALGCSQAAVSRIEKGQPVTGDLLPRTAAFLGLSPQAVPPEPELAPPSTPPPANTLAAPPDARLHLHALRFAAKLSITTLAARSGLSASQLARYERGTLPMTVPLLERLAQALGVPPAAFYGPAPAPPDHPAAPTIISTRFADGLEIDIRLNRPIDDVAWARLQTLLAPHAPGAARPPAAEPAARTAVDARRAPRAAPGPGSSLADRLRFARRLSHVTVGALARGTGLTTAMIESIESGALTTTPHLIKLARFLGVSPDWLDDGSGTPDRSPPS